MILTINTEKEGMTKAILLVMTEGQFALLGAMIDLSSEHYDRDPDFNGLMNAVFSDVTENDWIKKEQKKNDGK